MKKGFSIQVSEKNVEINSFISKDYDNFHLRNERFDLLVEGVLLNKKKLLHEYALKDFETLVLELYNQKKENLVKEFEGEIRGFIFDKTGHKLFVFTNITSTQRVFYDVPRKNSKTKLTILINTARTVCTATHTE